MTLGHVKLAWFSSSEALNRQSVATARVSGARSEQLGDSDS
jgi:hypothetical protein